MIIACHYDVKEPHSYSFILLAMGNHDVVFTPHANLQLSTGSYLEASNCIIQTLNFCESE